MIIKLKGKFDAKKTLESGQCFRFETTTDALFLTTNRGKVQIKNHKEGASLTGASEADCAFYEEYFDAGCDYEKIDAILTKDDTVKKAYVHGAGIKILRQEPFEALISFIISQNNNIPRIKKIIESLCQNFGEKRECELGEYYTFPCVQALDGVNLADLEVLRAGFRSKYIIDAVRLINSGEIALKNVLDMDIETAADYLKQIKGVGDKVAMCALLYGFGKKDAFPMDVWIKKVMAVFYPHIKTTEDIYKIFPLYAGIAQQYLFYYARKIKLTL